MNKEQILKHFRDNFIEYSDAGVLVNFIGKDGIDIDDYIVSLVSTSEPFKGESYRCGYQQGVKDLPVERNLEEIRRTEKVDTKKGEKPADSQPRKATEEYNKGYIRGVENSDEVGMYEAGVKDTRNAVIDEVLEILSISAIEGANDPQEMKGLYLFSRAMKKIKALKTKE
jgi:hypothetical protein